MADNQVDLKLNLDFKGVNDALYQMIGQFNGTDKEFQKIANSIQKNAKNLEAAIKLFGPASQQAGAAAKKMEKDFQSLVANGIDPASASFKKMTASMPSSAGLDATTGSLRKNNMQWSNLALVIQDLPFGFRGIQNNLPALAGGFASMTGPVYLGISAIIAAVTAWDMGLFKLGETTKKAKEDQDDYTKALNSSISSAYGEISQVKSLVSIVNNQTISIDKRRLALKKLQDEYPGYFKNMSLEQTSVDGLALSVGELTKAMIARAEATAMTSEIEKIAAKRYENTKAIDKNEMAITNLKNSLVILSKESQYVSGGFGADAKKLASPYTLALSEIQKLENANKGLISSNEALQNSMSLLQNSVDFRTRTSIGLETNKPTGAKSPEQTAKENAQKLLRAQEVQISNYLDTLNERNKEIVESELKLQQDIATLNEAGFTNYQSAFTANKIRVEQINKKYNDKEIEEARKKAEQIARDAEIIDNRELQNSLDSLKIQSDVAMKIANLSGNANAADRIKILEEYKAGLYDLASVGGYTAEQFDKIDDALKRVDAAIDGSKDKVKDYSISWQETSNTINSILTNLVRDSIVKFSENIGKALAGEGTNPFEGFGLMIADAAIGIGKALIAYGVAITAFALAVSNPFAAIAAGAALVIAGSYLKSRLDKQSKAGKPTAFANGGIISGPTMGLMGEYPGASHNPEVVAPLDKLKSLIGGSGGGTLEARISGNDLLILMNKAGRTNNNTF